MGMEHAVGQVIQMLVVWVPVSFLVVALLRLLWRAGDRRPGREVMAGQERLSAEIATLTEELRSLRLQLHQAEPMS